jgi:hypothetical protein
MNRTIRHSAVAFALSALFIGAQAQSGKTTEQVRSELAEAIRSGDIISGESGLTLREQFPNRYPPIAKPAGLSRAQVQAELGAAIRGGQMIQGGEIGARADQGIPGAFPNELMVGQKTRAQVREELAEAIRTGDMLADGESGALLKDLNPARYAKAALPEIKVGADRTGTSVH